jgi:hypothetical protein
VRYRITTFKEYRKLPELLKKRIDTTGGFIPPVKYHSSSGSHVIKQAEDLMELLAWRTSSSLYRDDETRTIRWILTPTSKVVAYATSSADIDLVVISDGMIFSVLKMCFASLSFRQTFPMVGNPNLEEDRTNVAFDSSIGQGLKAESLVVPKCNERLHFSIYLFLACIGLVFTHELTHLKNGHLNLIEEYSGMQRAGEVTDVEVNKVQQTLEWDADSGGTSQLIAALSEIKYNIEMPSELSEEVIAKQESEGNFFVKLCANLQFRFEVIVSAIPILFRTFSVSEWTEWEYSKSLHPHQELRIRYLMSAINQWILSEEIAADVQLDTTRLSKFLVASDLASLQIRREDIMEGTLFKSDYEEDMWEYHKEFDPIWKVIRPKLLKYMRTQTIPE